MEIWHKKVISLQFGVTFTFFVTESILSIFNGTGIRFRDHVAASLSNTELLAEEGFTTEFVSETDPILSEKRKQLRDFFVFMAISVISVIINLRVLYIQVISWKEARRNVSILVAHHTTVTILATLHGGLYFADNIQVISLRAPYLCGIVSFARNLLHVMFPLSVFGIIYERVRSFRMAQDVFLVYQTISTMWFTAILFTWPSLVSYEFVGSAKEGEYGICKKVLWLGVNITYELVRLTVFHFGICGGVSWALYTIRSKLKYLRIIKPVPNESTKRKIDRIQFVYIYGVLFLIVWLPVGVLLFVVKLLFPGTFGDTNNIVNIFTKILSLLYYMYCILNPLLYVCLNEGKSVKYVLGYYSIRSFVNKKYVSDNAESYASNESNLGEKRDEELSNMSRVSTIQLSERISSIITDKFITYVETEV